ncbi:MAG: carboxypeptidase regulatory-like domain-containing protein, partial [Bryobacteraceae bacterium]
SGVKKKKDFAGVVVWLKPLDDVPISYPRKRVEMLQKHKQFSPHILAISAGTTVDFPNLDPIFHNAFSNFEGKIFDIGLYPPGSSRSVRFDRPGIVRVFCNIHPSMSAIIVVVDSLYFTTTDARGSFFLPNVPPGTYEVHFFHERATPETLQGLVRTVSAGKGLTELAVVTISESGYLPVGHKNKYGRDYPASAGNQPDYMIR